MSEEPVSENLGGSELTSDPSSGRQKQKIRIKYRQRVKIKKRPRGYKITRYWRRNKKNIFAYIVLGVLLGATLYMVVQVAKQQIEMNQHQTRKRL